MDTETLLTHWLADAAVAAPQAGPERCAQEGARLLSGWSEPHRAYHTPQHLAETLQALDQLVGAGQLRPDEARTARLAAWYHDLHYDPRAGGGSNEHRSAALARDHLHHLGVAPDVVEAVEALVLMTVDHDVQDASPAADAFHDADLWILSAPAERYTRYAAQVRTEYAHVPPGLFAAVRGRVLQDLLERDELYRTAHARECWTAAARANLERELDVLTPAGDSGAEPERALP